MQFILIFKFAEFIYTFLINTYILSVYQTVEIHQFVS